MKFGDFDKLALNYAKYRPTYNFLLTKKIIKQFKKKKNCVRTWCRHWQVYKNFKKTKLFQQNHSN